MISRLCVAAPSERLSRLSSPFEANLMLLCNSLSPMISKARGGATSSDQSERRSHDFMGEPLIWPCLEGIARRARRARNA